MLKPKTIGAIAFVAVAAAGAWWELSRKDARKETAPPPRVLPAFAAGDVDEIIVTDASKPETVSLAKRDGAWRVTAPLDDAADAKNVDAALKQLSEARVGDRPAATSAESWERLKVGAAEVVTVTVRGKGADIATLHLGGDGRFARVGDGAAVYQVRGIARPTLARDVTQWRDRTVISLARDKVKTVTALAADGARASAERTPAPPPEEGKAAGRDTWTLTAGQQIVGQLDESVPIGIVGRMQALVATEFADDKTKADAGLTAPWLTLTVTTDDGVDHTLLVGATEDGNVYVGRPDSERVWKVAKATVDGFARPPLQWKDKTVAKLTADEVAKLDITHEGFHVVAERADGGWKVLQPRDLPANTAPLDAIAAGLPNLRGQSIATHLDRKAFAKPTAVVRITTTDRRAITLTLGAKQTGDLWPAKASTRNDVLLIPDYLARRLLVRKDDFTPKPPPSAPPGPHGMPGMPGM